MIMRYKIVNKRFIWKRLNKLDWIFTILPFFIVRKGFTLPNFHSIAFDFGFLCFAWEFSIFYEEENEDERCCGNCATFSIEDANGDGWCDKRNKPSSCDEYCKEHEFKHKKER